MTPVFFGSALTNFGVQLFLDAFVELAPAPSSRETSKIELAEDDERFSGFVFKIQANMDPRHRDRVAFLRVCSGHFERDTKVLPSRDSSARCALRRPLRLFGQEREMIEEAYAGDVIG